MNSMAQQKTLYRGGSIFTMDPILPRAEAVFVENGIIKAVGSMSDVSHLADADTRKIDLGGSFLVPGLIESHNHLSYFSLFTEQCYLGGGVCKTIDDVITKLKDHASGVAEGEHIMGYCFDDTYTPELRALTKEDLDRVSTEVPVLVTHMSGHGGYVNNPALKMFGITNSTENPKGGWIDRDEHGNATGKLEENAWFDTVGEKAPLPTDVGKIQTLLKKGIKIFNEYGITAVHDAAVGIGGNGRSVVEAYETLEKNGELNMRAFASWMMQADPDYQPEQIDGAGMGNRRFVVGGVKMFVDGSIQINTAALLSPYKNKTDTRGEMVMTAGEIEAEILAYHKRGEHISVHANGDASIEAVITAFEKAQQAHYRKDTRHMLIHCQMAHEDHIHRMKAAGVIPSFFGMHINYYGDRHVDIFLGQERAERLDPCGDADRAGLDFTLHTDTPVMPPWTMKSMGTAVTRKTKGGRVLGEDQRISPKQALAAYTTMAAKCSYSENQRGSISVGKLADLTLLSQDITLCDPEAIQDTKILKTIIEDQTVFEA
jgi:predicted amidohydrolase YtcJ